MINKSMYNAIDLFSGCGGLSEGLRQAGFKIIAGVEIEKNAARAYKMNHPATKLFEDDIRKIDTKEISNLLKNEPLHLLAGCPPCQGFSALRRLNRKQSINDKRNELIEEYYRFVEELEPLTIMLENVPGLINYSLFEKVINKIEILGYHTDCKIVNISDYGVPQRRKRLVFVGSILGKIEIAPGKGIPTTVRDALEQLSKVDVDNDDLSKIYPRHRSHIQELISLIPKNGGSRKDLSKRFQLKCHQKENVGFNDIYGRLKWDAVASTITGGCLNPSKGRFLHPEKDRCITAREATLLQTFPIYYQFPTDIPRSELSLLIGNALPPKFSRRQGENILHHIEKYYDGHF